MLLAGNDNLIELMEFNVIRIRDCSFHAIKQAMRISVHGLLII